MATVTRQVAALDNETLTLSVEYDSVTLIVSAVTVVNNTGRSVVTWVTDDAGTGKAQFYRLGTGTTRRNLTPSQRFPLDQPGYAFGIGG